MPILRQARKLPQTDSNRICEITAFNRMNKKAARNKIETTKTASNNMGKETAIQRIA